MGIRLYQYYALFLVASQTKIPDSFTSFFSSFSLCLSPASPCSSLFSFLGLPRFTSHRYSALVSSPLGLYTPLLHIQCPDSGSFPSLALIAHLVSGTILSDFDSPSSSLSLCYLASRSVVIKQCGSSCPDGNHFPTSDSDSRHIIAEYNLILSRSRPVETSQCGIYPWLINCPYSHTGEHCGGDTVGPQCRSRHSGHHGWTFGFRKYSISCSIVAAIFISPSSIGYASDGASCQPVRFS